MELLLLGHHLLDLLGGEIDDLHLLLGALHHLLLGGERLAGHAHGAHALLLLHHGLNLLGGEVDDLVLLLVLRRERKGKNEVRNTTICHCFPTAHASRSGCRAASRARRQPRTISALTLQAPCSLTLPTPRTVPCRPAHLPLFSQPHSPRALAVAQRNVKSAIATSHNLCARVQAARAPSHTKQPAQFM